MLHFTAIFVLFFVKLGFFGSSVGKESTHNAGDPGLIPGSGKFTGEGIDYSLQYSWVSLMVPLVKKQNKTKQNKKHLQCRRPGFYPWIEKNAWRKEQLPTHSFWPGEFHRLYSPCVHK